MNVFMTLRVTLVYKLNIDILNSALMFISIFRPKCSAELEYSPEKLARYNRKLN